MVHDAEYDKLLWIALHKLSTTFMLTNLSVDSLWRCWRIAKHCIGVHIHKLNVEQLTRVLQRNGFTLTPYSEMVIRIPSGAQYSQFDIVSVLRRALLLSCITLRVCDHAIRTSCVVTFAKVTFGQKLITTK